MLLTESFLQLFSSSLNQVTSPGQIAALEYAAALVSQIYYMVSHLTLQTELLFPYTINHQNFKQLYTYISENECKSSVSSMHQSEVPVLELPRIFQQLSL